MLISPADLLIILSQYKYWIIFPIAVFEGPIMGVISGFLVHSGYLNPYITYIVLLIADLIGDSLYYSIGRFWRKSKFIKKIGRFVGYDDSSDDYLEQYFKKHKIKTFMIGKFAHGLGGTVQIAGGIARVSYYEFLWLSFIGTIPKAFLLMVIGYYAGNYYERINGYLQNIAVISISVFLLTMFFIVSKKIRKNLIRKDKI